MKPVKIILSALCLMAAVLLPSCMAFDEGPNKNGSLDNNNNAEIKLYLSGVVKSTAGGTIRDIKVHIQGTEYMESSDKDGLFVIESFRNVTIGNADEKVFLIATDRKGIYTPRIVEVTIGEWSNQQKTIDNIEIVMEPALPAN